jgi:multidrug resistance protein, MATE family
MVSLSADAALIAEVRATVRLAAPMVLASVLRKLMETVTVIYLGSLGPTALASASLATTTINVLGMSVFVGFSSATATLVSQAHGAGDTRLIATLLVRAALIQLCASIPVVLVLANLETIMVLLGQQPELAAAAQRFCTWMIPGVYAFSLVWVVNPWLFSRGLQPGSTPML